jgi:hypothetical protein
MLLKRCWMIAGSRKFVNNSWWGITYDDSAQGASVGGLAHAQHAAFDDANLVPAAVTVAVALFPIRRKTPLLPIQVQGGSGVDHSRNLFVVPNPAGLAAGRNCSALRKSNAYSGR